MRIAHRCVNFFEKIGQITRDTDTAIGERVAESDLGINQEFCERPQIADPHRETRRDIGRRKALPVSEHQPLRSRANDPEYQREEPLLDSRKTLRHVHMAWHRRVNCPHAAAPERIRAWIDFSSVSAVNGFRKYSYLSPSGRCLISSESPIKRTRICGYRDARRLASCVPLLMSMIERATGSETSRHASAASVMSAASSTVKPSFRRNSPNTARNACSSSTKRMVLMRRTSRPALTHSLCQSCGCFRPGLCGERPVSPNDAGTGP